MIYKVLAAAVLLSSAEALKLNGIGMTRRAAFATAASLAVPLAPAMPAFAELMKQGDAEIYKVRTWTQLRPLCSPRPPPRLKTAREPSSVMRHSRCTMCMHPPDLPFLYESFHPHASGRSYVHRGARSVPMRVASTRPAPSSAPRRATSSTARRPPAKSSTP